MKNNRKYRELPKTPRTRPIVNGEELRELRDLAEVVAVVLNETESTPAVVDFDSYRPRLDALGLSVLGRVERLAATGLPAGMIALEAAEVDAVVLQFPGAATRADH